VVKTYNIVLTIITINSTYTIQQSHNIASHILSEQIVSIIRQKINKLASISIAVVFHSCLMGKLFFELSLA
jgi:hypothetical protein